MFHLALITALLSTAITPKYFLANRDTRPIREEACAKSSVQEEFFSPSQTLSEEEIERCQRNEKLDMSIICNQKDTQVFRFISLNDEIWYELCFIGKLPFSLEKYRMRFNQVEKRIEGKLHKAWVYTVRVGRQSKTKTYVDEAKDTLMTANSLEYILAARRAFKEALPQVLSIEDLKEIMKSSKVLFYTGAGISVAAHIPSQKQLYPLLGIVEGDYKAFFKKVINKPSEIVAGIRAFHNSCFFHLPTKAHFVLKKWAEENQAKILTENLDCLHEQTGIIPYKVSAQALRKSLNPKTFDQVDYIVCVGLSHDDKGFLSWYKSHHSKGKIIAIDYVQPEYLGDEDYWINQDLQEVCALL
ncbi:MAG: NAD-dependent protein deacetylase [Chlamydiae bacterium]|nr:NAD-dependent protein deacetylase [Chlamydiota bacterium]